MTIKEVIPSFRYRLSFGLADLRLSSQLRKRLEEQGATIISVKEDGYAFSIKSIDLLNKLLLGEVLATVRNKKNEFEISLDYKSQRIGFFLVATLFLALNITACIHSHGREILTSIFQIAMIVPLGHIYFWFSGATDEKRLKKFLMKIGEGSRSSAAKNL